MHLSPVQSGACAAQAVLDRAGCSLTQTAISTCFCSFTYLLCHRQLLLQVTYSFCCISSKSKQHQSKVCPSVCSRLDGVPVAVLSDAAYANTDWLTPFCTVCAGTVQFVTGPDGTPTEAILYGVGAQATFQSTAGQVVVATNNSPGTVSIPIDSNGNPSIPAGSNLSVVSTNSSIPSISVSSPGGYGKTK